MNVSTEMILWFMGVQSTIIVGIIGFMCKMVYNKIEKLEDKIQKLEDKIEKLENRISDMDKRVYDVDKRLYAIECMMHHQEGCVLKEDKQFKKAE